MKITVEPRREEALQAGYAALGERVGSIGFELFCERLRDWTVRAFCDGERVVGMLMTKGAELHVAVLPEARGRWLSRRLIREVFAPILARGESPIFKAGDGDECCQRFVAGIRAGFAAGRFNPMLIAAGGAVISGMMQADAAESAADTAAGAQSQATDAQRQIFNTQNRQQEPYRQAGYTALGMFRRGTDPNAQTAGADATPSFKWEGQDYGTADRFRQANLDNYRSITGKDAPAEIRAQIDNYITQARARGDEVVPGGGADQGIEPGQFLHQFTADDLKTNLAPNYEFMKQQGLGATQNLLASRGGALSGNTLQGLTEFGTNFAGNAYQNAFSNYTTNQTNIFNRLASIAGLGQTANAQSGQVAGALAPGIASSIVGAGQASAAGTVGAANALAGGANNALGWYQLSNLTNPTGGGGYGTGADYGYEYG